MWGVSRHAILSVGVKFWQLRFVIILQIAGQSLHEFYDRHSCAVAFTRRELDDADISALPFTVSGGDVPKKQGRGRRRDAGSGLSAAREGAGSRRGDQFFGKGPEFLCPRFGRANTSVRHQLRKQAAEERPARVTRSAEFSTPLEMLHRMRDANAMRIACQSPDCESCRHSQFA